MTSGRKLELFHELADAMVLRLNSCREEWHGAQWVENKAHQDYDLWFVLEGRIRLQIGSMRFTAEPGDTVFFYPDLAYTASTEEEGCRFIFVHFDYGLERQLRILQEMELDGIIPSGLLRREADLFLEAYRHCRELADQPGTQLYLKGCLSLVTAKLIELYSSGSYRGSFSAARRESGRKLKGPLAALQPVFRRIHEQLDRPPRMQELATIADMSEKYFIAFFRQALGITPGQYLYQVRMNRARDYIYEQRRSIQEISALLGYPDPSTFSKAFKKYYKVPPSRFL